jgi:hypothetical protein
MMQKKDFHNGCLALIALLFILPASASAQPQLVEQNKDWAVFENNDDANKVCFIISQPKSYDPMPVSRHGDVFFYVTRRPADDVKAEPSLKVGYEFRQDSKVTVSIGDKSFPFMTTKEYAFADDGVSSSDLAAAMRAGSDMKVTGTSSRGTEVTYIFSLSGVTAGMDKLSSICQ